jgi:hypothetical protein
MLRWIIAAICPLLFVAQEQASRPATKPAETQPASQPAGTTLRNPEQIEILKNLLNRQDRAMPVRPQPAQKPGQEAPTSQATDAEGHPLLLEGTFLSERPGRLVREEGRAKFVCYIDGGGQAPRAIEILESQLLEAMEREAEAGFSEFIVSGEVTRYRGRNYLLLRKILRRVDNGNLGP